MAPSRKKTIWAVAETDSLSPEQSRAQQRRGRFVDSDRVFQRDRGVGYNEDRDDCG
jgi:hypothetical protein